MDGNNKIGRPHRVDNIVDKLRWSARERRTWNQIIKEVTDCNWQSAQSWRRPWWWWWMRNACSHQSIILRNIVVCLMQICQTHSETCPVLEWRRTTATLTCPSCRPPCLMLFNNLMSLSAFTQFNRRHHQQTEQLQVLCNVIVESHDR